MNRQQVDNEKLHSFAVSQENRLPLGKYVTFYEEWVFYQLRIRKLTIRTINIDLMKNTCIDELFSMS